MRSVRAITKIERALSAPPVVGECFALPGEDGDAGFRDGRAAWSCVENVATRPAHGRAERDVR